MGSPNLWQWTFSAVDRIIVWNWQRRDILIGLGPLARQTPKQIPFASIGVSSNNSKIFAGTNILVSYTGWNHNYIAGMHLNVFAVRAAESQGGSAAISSKHFMRRAVIVSEGIDAVSPRIRPIVLGKTLFNNRSAIARLCHECLSIQ
jgi:hypothetical protein